MISENMPPSRFGMAAPAFFVLTAFSLTLAVVFALYTAWFWAGASAFTAFVCAWLGYRDVRKANLIAPSRVERLADTIEIGLSPPTPRGEKEHEPNLETDDANR